MLFFRQKESRGESKFPIFVQATRVCLPKVPHREPVQFVCFAHFGPTGINRGCVMLMEDLDRRCLRVSLLHLQSKDLFGPCDMACKHQLGSPRRLSDEILRLSDPFASPTRSQGLALGCPVSMSHPVQRRGPRNTLQGSVIYCCLVFAPSSGVDNCLKGTLVSSCVLRMRRE